MINIMDLENIFVIMVISMRVNLKMIKEMDLEHIFLLMEISTNIF
jgi:hypothetical protein